MERTWRRQPQSRHRRLRPRPIPIHSGGSHLSPAASILHFLLKCSCPPHALDSGGSCPPHDLVTTSSGRHAHRRMHHHLLTSRRTLATARTAGCPWPCQHLPLLARAKRSCHAVQRRSFSAQHAEVEQTRAAATSLAASTTCKLAQASRPPFTSNSHAHSCRRSIMWVRHRCRAPAKG